MSGIAFMKDKELLEVTPVENIFISQFMPQAPDIAVKAYLYGLMLISAGLQSADEDIAAALGCSDTDVYAAFSYWQTAGLVEIVSNEPFAVRYLNIRNALMKGRVNTAGARYGEFVGKLQKVLGTRILSGSELAKIYDWIEVFGFEQEAAQDIVRRCLDTKGAKVSVAYMDKVAKSIASKGALTHESVAAYFEEEDRLTGGAARILKRWNQSGRVPTEDEIALYEKWTTAWGFDEAGLDLALREMTAAVKPSFKYLDGLLTSWRENGRIDRSAIEADMKKEDMIAELARAALTRAGIKSRPSREHRDRFREWYSDWSMSAELIYLAADIANKKDKPFAYMKMLLDDWHGAGISSVSAAKERYENTKNDPRRTKGGSKRSLTYIHSDVKYTEDDLKRLGISLGEEFYDDEH
ncbi:MAG: DnaD domain protein [Clostridia bacterium]|nr:DnaD domain protein [Clostridia bacterium]